jgi:tetratricopeptide (TPR) repeat protein
VLVCVIACCSACTPEPVEDTSRQDSAPVETIFLDAPKPSLKEATSKYLPSEKSLTSLDYSKASEKAAEQRDYDAAYILADKAVALDPQNGRAYYTRGRCRCYAVVGDDGAAINDLQKAIAIGIDPDADNAYEYLARLYDARKQPAKAIQALTEAIKINPGDPGYYKIRASLQVERGAYGEAEKDFDQAVKLNPKSLTYFTRAQFFEKVKNYDAALKDYVYVIKLEQPDEKISKRVLAQKHRAEIFALKNKHLEAIRELTDALKARTNDDEDELLWLRGQQYAQLKMYEKAIADYTSAIDSAPEFAGAYEARSAAYEKIGKTELAQKDRLKAQKLQEEPAITPLR